LCPPPSSPEEVQRSAKLEASRREAEALLAAKEEAVRAHFAAITEVVYQLLSEERKAEIDKIADAAARSSAISSFRAELLSHDEAEADNLEDFLTQVHANADFPRSAELLNSARASGEAAPHL